MATAFASNNAFNLAETAAVVVINGDAWLGNTTNVKTVHAKIRTGDDVHALYYPYELPAIGVQALGASSDDKDTIGQFAQTIRLGFDVWAVGPSFSTVDTTIKQVMAYLRRKLRLQAFAPAVNAESSEMDTFCTNGDVAVGEADFEHYPAPDGGWLAHGVTFADLTCISLD